MSVRPRKVDTSDVRSLGGPQLKRTGRQTEASLGAMALPGATRGPGKFPSALASIFCIRRSAALYRYHSLGQGMGQFYTTNEADVRRCREALADQRPILITATVEDTVQAFNGIVQSIEEDRNVTPKRWRVTIIDAE